jgi:hypothetical protein
VPAGFATVAEQFSRAPSFPVRCRDELAKFAEQISSMTVPPTTAASRGLVRAAGSPVDEAWFGATQALDAAGNPPAHSDATSFDWLHFDGGLRKAAELEYALDAWYPTLKAGGLLSGSNFLQAGDPRNPLVNTGGFTATKEILFLHAEEASYKTRLDGTDHAVRSTIKAFALKHSLQLFVTYMYDCHTEPTWYMVKPNDKALSTRAPVARHTIGKGPAQCREYESSVGGVAVEVAIHDCTFAENVPLSASKINSADAFPIRCRDDLPILANELGLTGKAAEVGVWAGAYAAKNLRAWKGSKYVMVDRWAPQSGDLPGCKAGSAACADKVSLMVFCRPDDASRDLTVVCSRCFSLVCRTSRRRR